MRSTTSLLAFALLSATSGAHAVMPNPRGEGQALAFPYCTVNIGAPCASDRYPLS